MIEVNVSTETATIQVIIPQGCQLQVPDTRNNKRLLLILLRLLQGTNGKPLMTFAQIAAAFGYADRRNVNNFWREFEQSGRDFLAYLARKYKIDERIRDGILEVFLEDILASVDAVRVEVRRRLGLDKKDLAKGTVRQVLGDVLKVQSQVKKMLAAGSAQVRDRFLIEELFGLVETAAAGVADPTPWAQEKVAHLAALAGRDEAAATQEVVRADAELVRELTKSEGTVAAWAQEYVWLFLLYWHGISAATLGKWFGLHKTTVWRRVVKFSALGVLAAGLVAGVSSGVIGVDEKWIRIGGKWHYLFTAVDLERGLPLHFEIYKSRSGYYCRLFLSRLRQLGFQPRLIVTDGWVGYWAAIKKVFPTAQHQLCIFHVMRSIMQWLKQHIRSEDLVAEYGRQAKRIFQTTDKRTAERRYKKLKRRRKLKALLRRLRRKWSRIVPALGSTWIPTTNNGSERFNRAFERFYRARQAFGSRLSAYAQVRVFWLGFLINEALASGQAPLTQVKPAVRDWALYQLWNKPDFSKLRFAQAQRGRKAA